MEFSVVTRVGDAVTGTPDITRPIMTTHHAGTADETPLRMVSEARLARLLAIEQAYGEIAAAVLSLDGVAAGTTEAAMQTSAEVEGGSSSG